MIYISTALYAEAKPIIQKYNLKQEKTFSPFPVFLGEHIILAVTGPGLIKSAINLTRLFEFQKPSSSDFYINLGICGALNQTFAKDSCTTQNRIPVGSIFAASKLLDFSTGNTFYPDIFISKDSALEKLPFLPVCSSPVPVSSEIASQIEKVFPYRAQSTTSKYEQDLLFDMEAVACYQAAVSYFTTSGMLFLKVVSDIVEDTEKLSSDERMAGEKVASGESNKRAEIHPDELILRNMSLISDILNERFEDESPSVSLSSSPSLPPIVLSSLKPTKAMEDEILRFYIYFEKAGIKYLDETNLFLSDFSSANKSERLAKYHSYLDFLFSLCEKNVGFSAEIKDKKRSTSSSLFKNVYLESDLVENETVNGILRRLPDSKLILINHYKDVFNRGGQNYRMQKRNPSLILAKETGSLLYPGAPVCQSFGNEHFYYSSLAKNCIFDCEYCYLQGMYPSGHQLIFVNQEDYFKEIDKTLALHPVYLCISYDTDLLAVENLFGFVSQWMDFAKNRPNLTIEIRTKCGNVDFFTKHNPVDNVIFAWTISADNQQSLTEHHTPTTALRLKAAKTAIENGFRIRLCFDPVLFLPNIEEDMKKTIDYSFEMLTGRQASELTPAIVQEILGRSLSDVSLGTFRISKDYIKNIKKNRPDSTLLCFPFETVNNVCTQGRISDKLVSQLSEYLIKYISKDRIY